MSIDIDILYIICAFYFNCSIIPFLQAGIIPKFAGDTELSVNIAPKIANNVSNSNEILYNKKNLIIRAL